MTFTTRTSRGVAVSAALVLAGVVILAFAHWEQIRIRWLISRFGKDQIGVSGHLYVDRSSRELERIGPSAIPYLDDAFDSEPRPEIRRLMILTLWSIGDDAAGPTIVKALSDPATAVRDEAALVAGKLRIAGALPRLRGLVQDADDGLRETAFFALGQVGTSEELPLAENGMRDENPRVRAQAREAHLAISGRESPASAVPAGARP